ncbi:hypothetical protein SDC9_17954 [bioreactor metagenome]|uniref:Uncharacterized protein n=1 Tax=bioreactor metagenome TaxID=1076179 RepID=A0A644TYZ9_9ZZZZ|nr:hypothetical protein [Lentimicrobium sp.]MEA5110948.1 hypothetical protein [Lentimicrobium sp.]
MTNQEIENLKELIYQVPERLNQFDETTTAELLYYLLKQTHDQATELIRCYIDPHCSFRYSKDKKVLEMLFIFQNRKFEPAAKRLSEKVLSSHYYDTAMYSIKVLKMERTAILTMFENMLTSDLSENESSIIQIIIKYLSEKPKQTRPPKEPQTLFDIWIPDHNGTKDVYYRMIKFLKLENRATEAPFVYEVNEKLIWNETIRGNRKYLAAFIYQMTENKWIEHYYSAPEYKAILQNSFVFKNGFNREPFKSLSSRNLPEKYYRPFQSLPINISSRNS